MLLFSSCHELLCALVAASYFIKQLNVYGSTECHGAKGGNDVASFLMNAVDDRLVWK